MAELSFYRAGELPDGRELRNVVLLDSSNWDDYFQFQTSFYLTYFDAAGEQHAIGSSKIGRVGLLPGRIPDEGVRKPDPPGVFSELPDEFFSLGQDTSYYERLEALGGTFREKFLKAMRDVAFDADLLDRVQSEEVMGVSLLRDVPLRTVRDQYARLANGGALLTPYRFIYKHQVPKGDPIELNFRVEPNSHPPSNIHVLIGRNGVGKSTLLNELAKEFTKQPVLTDSDELALSNIVSVSFSAFDEFEPISIPRDRTKGLTYHYVGLKKKDEPGTKDLTALASEMTKSARICLQGARRARWARAVGLLETDPIFAEAGIGDLISNDGNDDDTVLKVLSHLFKKRFSSGHKIVLLTVTKLVETVEEKSLVLLDEPETHLHPPLLSAFIRSLSDLLTNRNAVALIATHSPVVLQEVPSTCVWKLNRRGWSLAVDRIEIETFGENIGTLTDDVFGLEVTATGFHKMLADAAQNYFDYESALASFGGQVGAEGRAILRAHMAVKNSPVWPRGWHVDG